jgi:uncharacterized protein
MRLRVITATSSTAILCMLLTGRGQFTAAFMLKIRVEMNKILTYAIGSTWLWIATIALAGCSLLSPVPDKSKYFVVTPTAPGTSASQINQGITRGLVLGLGPIKLPDYLNRTEIVTRIEPNQLQLAENDHWAEPLKDNFTRVLSQNLSTLLGTQQIVNFPWYSSTHIDYQIIVTVDRFECDNQGTARLAARWSINDPVSERILNRNDADLTAPCSGDVDQGVAGLSQTLSALSGQIAMAMSQVAATRRPPDME